MRETIYPIDLTSANSKKKSVSWSKLLKRKAVWLLTVIWLSLTVGFGIYYSADFAQKANAETNQSEMTKSRSESDVQTAFGKLAMSFEINQGQTDNAVRFISRGTNYNLYLADNKAVLSLYKKTDETESSPSSATVEMSLTDSNPSPQISGINELEGKVNYIIGRNPENWKMGLSTFGKVKYAGVYEGIDLVYYGNQSELEYDFVVAPNANPNAIKIQFNGAEDISIDQQSGELVLKTATGEVRQHAPVIYQEINGERQTVQGRYKLIETKQIENQKSKIENPLVGFEIDEYDQNQTLVIDPVLLYSTYLGGSETQFYSSGHGELGGFSTGDGSEAIAVDENGFAYIAGVAHSRDFPLANAAQNQCRTLTPTQPCFHAFIAKLNQSGDGLVYSTFLGGQVLDFGNGYTIASDIAVDNAGNAYITGKTNATDFPTTPGAFQSAPPNPNLVVGGFVTKLNPSGALSYSTYLTGAGIPFATELTLPKIAIDAGGNAYIAGTTTQADFPNLNGFQTQCARTSIDNNTCYYPTGYLAKLNAAGSNLLYATFIGSTRNIREGTAPTVYTVANDVAVDNEGNAFVVGSTNLREFTVRRPLPGQGALNDVSNNCADSVAICADGFVVKIKTTVSGASSLVFSSFLGAVGHDWIYGVALDNAKNVYVTGFTFSSGFPTTPNAYDRTCGTTVQCNSNSNGGVLRDAFVTKIKAKLNGIGYSTFLGGDRAESGNQIKVDQNGKIYVIGETESIDFPTTTDALQSQLNNSIPSAFITEIAPTGELNFSTYLHGNNAAETQATKGTGIDVDLGGNIYVTGGTTSRNFPVRNAFQPTHHAPNTPNTFSFNAFVTKIGKPTPVIFIPGISGSYLYDDTSTVSPERWVGIGTIHDYLTLDPNSPFYKGEHLYAPDVLRTLSIVGLGISDFYGPLLDSLKKQGGYVEYDVNNDPNRRTLGGCDVVNQQSRNPSLFVLAYDWRRDNAFTANQRLAAYVQCIEQFYGADTKVNIVTHSMGSLIARRYILEHPGKVKKHISIGAPWLGGPKSINVLATGDFLDDIGHFAVAGRETFKSIAQTFPGAHQLIPTRSFFALGGRPYYERDASGNIKVYNNYDEFIARLNALYPLTRPGDNDRNFHDFPGQDDWRNDNTGVQYYHIFGVRSAVDTINRVQQEPAKRVCSVSQGGVTRCRDVTDYTIFYTTGDGTVPRLSAERKANGLNLNAPNARVVIFTTPSDKLVEHTGLNNNPAVQRAVLTFLNEPLPAANTPLAESKNEDETVSAATVPIPVQPDYKLKFIGLPTVTVADDFGNSTAPLPNDPDLLGEVPGVSYRYQGAETITLTMPTGQNFTVTFTMPNQPVMLEWTKGTNKLTTDAGRYLDLNLPQNTNVRLTITTAGVQDLRYDADNNGSFETLINPTAQVSGASANDKDAPLVSFNETAQGGMSNLAISAIDNGSGVRSLMYSTNGTDFQSYTAPLLLNSGQTVYAFSDDNNGNRSGTVSYQTGTFKLKVNGSITDNNGGVGEVVLNLTDSQNNTVTTQSVGGGIYLFAGLTSGSSYTLTPEHPFYTFSPPSVSLSNLTQNTTVNFTATRKTYNISGRVTDDENNGVSGVSLTLPGGQTATTNSNGNYTFFNLAAGEDYVITASKPFFDFKDAALQVSELSANETADFTGTQRKFGISGQINDVEGNGFARITVTLSNGSQTFTTQTDQSGLYFFDDLDGGGNYTVTPSKPGATFMPQNRSFNNLDTDANGDFTSPVSPNTWTGEVSTDWFNATNWVGGAVPPPNANVIVPSGALNEIIIGSNDVTVAGLTLQAGRTLTINNGRSLTVANNAVINGILNGQGTFNGNGTTTFSGTSPQTIPPAVFLNLTVNNPSGATLLGDVAVNGELNLTSGIVDNGAFTLTLTVPATVVRTNGFVVGNLRKNFPGIAQKNLGFGNTFVFPVGTNSAGVDYSPVEINGTNVSGDSGYLTVKAFDTASPAPIGSPKISRYWQLDGANITTDLTFHYLAEDADTVTNPTRLRVFRNSQSVCTGDCVDETTRTATVTNVSNFSPWTLAEVAPTASNVTISGRVRRPNGQGVFNAIVQMTDANGRIRTAKTNPFGFYRFDNVEAGQTYIFSVRHRIYRFNSQAVTVNDELQNLDFTAVLTEGQTEKEDSP